jgi:two-component system sensor histidine kinase KdpD
MTPNPTSVDRATTSVRASPRYAPYAASLAACFAVALLAMPLTRYFDPANIVMLFLLAVVVVGVRLGRGPAVLAAFSSVAMFDFFFVPPQFSFTVSDAQYLLTFFVMLSVAVIIGQLTAGLRQQAKLALSRETRTRALYETARELAGVTSVDAAVERVNRFVRDTLDAESAVFLQNTAGALTPAGSADPSLLATIDGSLLELALVDDAYADLDTRELMAYFRIPTLSGRRCVLVVSFRSGADATGLQEQHALLEAVASLAASVLDRLYYVEAAGKAQLDMQTERLRSSILSALSHDVRTPLTVLTGLADSLTLARPAPAAQHIELAAAIRDQAMRLSGLVSNLLDMARLNAGDIRLRREWQPIEEVIGSSIKLLGPGLLGRRVRVRLPRDLPLVEIDAILMERVLCNLLENAAKYSPDGEIEINAMVNADTITVAVRDEGPGVGDVSKNIFDMFVRGEKESSKPGLGLGLAICRAIVEAHGGTIDASNRASGGACFAFTLPRGTPPSVQIEELSAADALT